MKAGFIKRMKRAWIVRKGAGFLSTWKSAGGSATLVYAADKLLRALRIGRAHCYLFVCQPVKPIPDSRLLAKNVTCRELTTGEFDLLPSDPGTLENARRQDATAIGAFVDGRSVGTLWYTIGPYFEDEVRAIYEPLPAGHTAWDFGVEIAPQYRMGRTFLTLWAASMSSLESRGCKHSFSRINAVNEGSVRSHARLGAVTVGYANFVFLGPLQIAWSSHPPRFHLSFSESRRPRYRLTPPGYGQSAISAAPAAPAR